MEATKKKSKKKLFIIGGVALAVIIAVIAIIASGGGIDHEGTVRMHRPLSSHGINATYGQVFSRFITSPNWSVDRDAQGTARDGADVTVSGNLSGSGVPISVVIRVTPTGNDMVDIDIRQVTLDGERSQNVREAEEFMLFMFDSFDHGDQVLDLYLWFFDLW